MAIGGLYGVQTFDQDLMAKVRSGLVTMEDAMGLRRQRARLQAGPRGSEPVSARSRA